MEINVLNEIYDAYKGRLEEASSIWYCCNVKEKECRDIEDLKYFESLLQKINDNWRPNNVE